ncbi:MAG: hypothetical protein JO201_01305, partial [Verrucomicrobia bacterium]|nr:hypothetical protein [Verrucomicrobiota bacterium]
MKAKLIFLSAIVVGAVMVANSQPTPSGPNISNKTLITSASQDQVMGAAALRKLADDYYTWRNENHPAASSERGLHTWD